MPQSLLNATVMIRTPWTLCFINVFALLLFVVDYTLLSGLLLYALTMCNELMVCELNNSQRVDVNIIN